MRTSTHRQLPPTAQEAEIDRISGQILAKYVHKNRPLTVHVAEQEEPIELPSSVVDLLMDIFEAMAAGHGVTIIPENAELTTVQAAEMLNVSRPFLIKLLDEKVIPLQE